MQEEQSNPSGFKYLTDGTKIKTFRIKGQLAPPLPFLAPHSGHAHLFEAVRWCAAARHLKIEIARVIR
jgi:hypothetical protein